MCRDSFDELSKILEDVESPLIEIEKATVSDEYGQGALSVLVDQMEEYIDNIAPPSVPLRISNDSSDASKFWLVMYMAWHYRLGPRFDSFAKQHGWGSDLEKAETSLGNLVLHALESLELRYRWQERYAVPIGGVGGA